MARPRKEFDKEQFEKLCSIQCTEMEIAAFFEISIDTVKRRCHEMYGESFAQVYKTYADQGRMSLRRKQLQIALNGNVTMLIWLGKQYLGQADKQEQNITTNFDGDENASKHYEQYAEKIFRQLTDKASTRRF